MKLLKKVLALFLIVVILLGAYLTYNGYVMYKDALNTTPLTEKITDIRTDTNYVLFEDIPTNYRNAVIAVEDHRFYNHPGIDIISISRAVYEDIKARAFVAGGSTITQQLCKNIYFTQEKKLTRKVAEMFMAFKMEKNYSKDEILELYINTCYFGSGYNGLASASYGYFNKYPNELNLYECTILAGIPNAPSVYSLNSNLDLTKARQKIVLGSMVKYEYISSTEANSALAESN